MRKWVPFALAALTVTACQDASGPASQLRPVASNLVSASRGVPIPGSYIVKFRDDVNEQDVDNSAHSLVKLHNGALKHVYKSALKGFAVKNLSAAAAAALANDPRVEFIEPDQVVTASTVCPSISCQTPVTWGLDRVDQPALPLDSKYNYYADGFDVTVYIIDTGINFSHPDFEGRAVKGIDEVTSGGSAKDCNGHGTHVSGTIGGKTYGIAKKVKLVAVRVLDCSGGGTSSGVIAGIDWVTSQQACPAGSNCGKRAAANMSLGTNGVVDPLLNEAVAKSVAAPARVTYAVAAGNSAADACSSSPSSEPSAITVGATDKYDAFAYFSNYGTCVKINAPGVDVTSDWLGTGTNTISGTSMASPHVAGAAALYLQRNPTATPAQVKDALVINATPNVITSIGPETPNLLLYTAFIGAGGAPPAPGANFTFSCTGLSCSFDGSSSTNTTSWSWNFGDATAAGSGSTITHAYLKAGTYQVTLTATNSGTVTSTKMQPVTVTSPPPPPKCVNGDGEC